MSNNVSHGVCHQDYVNFYFALEAEYAVERSGIIAIQKVGEALGTVNGDKIDSVGASSLQYTDVHDLNNTSEFSTLRFEQKMPDHGGKI